MSQQQENWQTFAIRFGLGAIKAVGFSMMENMVSERKKNGKFSNIYDFVERLDPKFINKKSIEALAKSGTFDSIEKNRRQIAESFEILSSHSARKNEEASSNQMSLFDCLPEINLNQELKKVPDWNRAERLQKEFEAFGFFLSEHPLDENISDLKKRGIVFSDKLDRDELIDGNLIKMAGIIAVSKHRSSSRGRFAYLSISDPFGIFEVTIFDEALITSARDFLVEGSAIAMECLIRSDEGGVRILVRDVKRFEEFMQNTKAQEKDFEDIKKQNTYPNRGQRRSTNQTSIAETESISKTLNKNYSSPSLQQISAAPEKNFSRVEIIIRHPNPIPTIRLMLAQRLANKDAATFSEVFFSVIKDDGIDKIKLPQKYSLTKNDILALRNTNMVIDVEAS